ncbi:tRNA(m1A58)-methyltransferase [Hyphodiscus hymeniophilus]|uniref:tRNA (adenine(58)-N(1))-methyltransferase catalytic subunit TRM61 n=1 Tax=Hyphodiscus hymeniophilus TaxID=353542 RepID=A0A9P7AUH7_9HELO|nr:tRNA(m1A58)-methyltransferase [Hyphodiscus hymeniophilus]
MSLQFSYTTGPKTQRKENDIVLLKQKRGKDPAPILSKPLRPGSLIATEKGRGSIAADDILGKRARDIVRNTKGIEFRILEPSLGEYTDLSPRLVTPIYSQDTSLIVSLLDLHPSNPGADNRGGHDKLEIFEAGTGHGALTLNLARAVHGANTPAPPIPQIKSEYENADAELEANAAQGIYHNWRGNRRAIIHTLDQSALYSKHAQKVVKDYRQGMYFPNVDFHVGSIGNFLSQRPETPSLDHAILDLPNTDHYLEIVGKALKSNGALITWCPSITQIIKCINLVKESHLPLLLVRVIEVGAGFSGGREWDVRLVKPRALSKAKSQVTESGPDEEEPPSVEELSVFVNTPAQNEGWEMICRPKVGMRIVGGGFIALWRKMEQDFEPVMDEESPADLLSSSDES